jgi:hypothetical protein
LGEEERPHRPVCVGGSVAAARARENSWSRVSERESCVTECLNTKTHRAGLERAVRAGLWGAPLAEPAAVLCLPGLLQRRLVAREPAGDSESANKLQLLTQKHLAHRPPRRWRTPRDLPHHKTALARR